MAKRSHINGGGVCGGVINLKNGILKGGFKEGELKTIFL